MTRAVLPSRTHSSVVLGPIFSLFRTSDGTETCPRLVILVRITKIYNAEEINPSSGKEYMHFAILLV
jgi:hypothetical protein